MTAHVLDQLSALGRVVGGSVVEHGAHGQAVLADAGIPMGTVVVSRLLDDFWLLD